MGVLTRDAILAANDVDSTLTAVEVPEWGGTVYVRAMTAGERGKLEEKVERAGKSHLRAIVAAACIADESGKPLFTDADIPALEQRSSKAMDRVLTIADRLNTITKGEMDRVGEPSEPPAA